jgi:hypothetical protein
MWSNTTYQRGSIRDLRVGRSRVTGVVLGPGPSDNREGLTLANGQIDDSDLWFLRIDGTQLLNVEFLDSKFRGAQLDLSGFAGVRFKSSPSVEAFVTPRLTIIEDSWIVQNSPPPVPNVIDLAVPEQEVLFEGVQFVRTRFDGRFKPEWFRGNRFEDCVFSVSTLNRDALLAGGNQLAGDIWLERRQP